MKILVMGSGIIGTTTAFYLARQGHQVDVIDRQPAAGMETSFANAGQISPGYSSPWAAPGIPFKALKWMFSRHSPLAISPRLEWDKIQFVTRLFGQCTAGRYHINKSRMLRLADYSQHNLAQFREENAEVIGPDSFDHQNLGTLQLFRTRKQLRAATQDMAILDQLGIPYQALDVDQCVDAEPALQTVRHKLTGGLRLPNDETGDCHAMARSLAQLCESLGVRFHYNVSIDEIEQGQSGIESVLTHEGRFSADRYVMALGSFSAPLLQSLGIDLPVYPVQGYSITLPIDDQSHAPRSTLMDETYKVALTRLGNRLRVAGMAELDGYRKILKPERRRTLRHVVADLFPQIALPQQDEFWTGLRPMTPDGTPIVGASTIDNLFINTGHGTLGWTMSFGSARLLADLISGRQPDIQHEDFSMSRYLSSQHHKPVGQKPLASARL